jgi:NAD+ diphosphatase
MNYCSVCGNALSAKPIDGCNRYVCTNNDCNYIYWNNPIPVVAALVQYNDNYVIARNAKWPPGIFSLITGYLEQGESTEQAVIREVSEELGLEGTIHRFLGLHTFVEHNQLIIAYEIHATGKLETNHELAEIKTLTHTELSGYNFKPLYITENIIREWQKVSLPEIGI